MVRLATGYPRLRMSRKRNKNASSTYGEKSSTVAASNQRLRPCPELLSGGTVQIKVGIDFQIFNVHEALICHSSPYFDRAIKWAYREFSATMISLPETSVRAFKLLLAWLYTEDIWRAGRSQSIPKLEELVDLYILADQVKMPFLQNDALEAINSALQMRPHVSRKLFSQIWENTDKHSPLRQLMIDVCVWNAGPEIFNIGRFPTEEVCVDVMRGLWMKSRRPKATSPIIEPGNYRVSTVGQTNKSNSKRLVCICEDS